MENLNPTQKRAYLAACEVIGKGRAEDIFRLVNWKHGGCLCLGSKRPSVPDVTSEEDQALRALWDALPGWTSWMTCLYMLRRQ
ncbi:hypothetical protein OAS39_12190 [Pirellulales bacterium]|nr:hypothetical protein [Pirellulales bacterium]